MNAFARWYHSAAWLFGRWTVATILLLIALVLAVWVGMSVDVFGSVAAIGGSLGALVAVVPLLMTVAWWNLVGGRAMSMWFNATQARLPHLRAELSRALAAWLVPTVLLPAAALSMRSGHFAMHFDLLLGSAALGALCAAMPVVVGFIVVMGVLIGANVLGNVGALMRLASPALLPWESIAAVALSALALAGCVHRLRRAGQRPRDIWLQRLGLGHTGYLFTLRDLAFSTDSVAAVGSLDTPWQRFAAAMGPPWAMPSWQLCTQQIITVLLMALFCESLGPNSHNGEPLPSINCVLVLLALAGGQSANMVQRRLSGATQALALLPGLGNAVQCRRRICFGLLRQLGLYALYVALVILAVALHEHLPWSWLAWTALWALSLLVLGVIVSVYAIQSLPMHDLVLYPLCFLAAMPACVVLGMGIHPGTGMAITWCVFTALVALLGRLVWRRWLKQPHPLLAR